VSRDSERTPSAFSAKVFPAEGFSAALRRGEEKHQPHDEEVDWAIVRGKWDRTMTALPIIQRLPTELKQCLLSAMSDIPTLRSMALSCSSYCYAFSNAETLITAQVMRNQMDVDVLPEAVAAFESSRLQPKTQQCARDFVRHHLHSRTAPTELWTLSKALSVSKLQSRVEFFARGFTAETLGDSSALGYLDHAPPHWRLSRTEVNRIHRAFYRFEVYCNLFRDPTLFNLSEQKDLFFSRFSNWENEQLACVHDFLFRLVCPGVFAHARS
jgi:hypothetical protein